MYTFFLLHAQGVAPIIIRPKRIPHRQPTAWDMYFAVASGQCQARSLHRQELFAVACIILGRMAVDANTTSTSRACLGAAQGTPEARSSGHPEAPTSTSIPLHPIARCILQFLGILEDSQGRRKGLQRSTRPPLQGPSKNYPPSFPFKISQGSTFAPFLLKTNPKEVPSMGYLTKA